METLLYLAGRGLVTLVQALPLVWVARLGRACGGVAYWFDVRHRRVAIANLEAAFGPTLSPSDIAALAAENFRRIGENFACAVRTAAMSTEEVRAVLEVVGAERLVEAGGPGKRSLVIAIGHFGNFELYARAGQSAPGYQFATTYRALRQPALNRLFQELRERSGCRYFERRSESTALKGAMNQPRIMVGFLADQHAGDRGLPVPFFGRNCSTSAAPGVFALRYGCPLFTAICYRVGLARWRIEVGAEIPTHADGQPRPVEHLAADVNRDFEIAVRRDPANWFWVHRRWKASVRPRSEPVRPADRPPTPGENQAGPPG